MGLSFRFVEVSAPGGPGGLDAAGRDVAVNLALGADEDDAVPGRVAGVPLHLGIGDRNARAVGEHALAVSDDGDVVIALDLERVGLESIRLAAAAHGGIVGLHEGLEPLADGGGRVAPL